MSDPSPTPLVEIQPDALTRALYMPTRTSRNLKLEIED
ncbi:hypothetical protein D1AOALGA4SA_720 [Olavius algarvensis Delta 1 endosymbiont]|nr:hypothetical protein D1AOALGA4SA_720 [Olavius algarvensis Delta 1 endosymbiont]